jgi:tetratricopeptide (TPR) repeat protein
LGVDCGAEDKQPVSWDCRVHACLKVEEVEAFVAGKLSAQDEVRIKAHIASCPDCGAAAAACERDRALARSIQQAYGKIEVSDSSATLPDLPLGSDIQASISDPIEGYEILHEIHRGGQGVVYKAVQLATKRTVALKVLLYGPYASAKQQHRFEREIDLVASLKHPNIVTIYDSGLAQGRHYFAMEYIHGQSLAAYLSDAKLSIDAVLRLFQKICSAVNAAHQRGVIHRDLKPGNIRIDSNGEPHILDFGLAKAAGSDLKDGAPVTISGEFMGTLAYASPEQIQGDPGLVDIRTDVYSLGVILFEMLTGTYPYEVGGPISEVLRNIAEAEPRRPSTLRRHINDEVETIVLQALAKEKERRYQSAEALARDVGHYLAGEPIDAKRNSAWYVLHKALRRHRYVAGVAAAFVLILAGSTAALSVMYRNQNRARQEAEAARTEAQRRADELETVTEFQQSMLGGIDAQEMGRVLYADLCGRVRAALEAEGASPEGRESAVASFEQALHRTNATDAALKLVDEQVLSRAVKAIESDFADQPIIRAALQQAVADTYREIGRYPAAEPLQEAALRTRRAELGDDHPDTLASISKMGALLESQGKLDEAEPYYRAALEGRRRVLGDQHLDTLSSVNNMGFLLHRQRKFAEAERYYREGLEGLRHALGDDHPNTLTSINNLGALLEGQGKFAEAEIYLCEGLEGLRRVLGNEHPNTLRAINNVGGVLKQQNKLTEAEPYFREALEGCRRVLGDEHPTTLSALNNMGALLEAQGKLVEAEPYYREALDVKRRVLGEGHPSTIAAMHNLGGLLRNLGQLEEAESLGANAVAGARESLPKGHPNTGVFLLSYGVTLSKLERYSEAEAALLEAHAILEAAVGGNHASAIKAGQALVDLYDAWYAAAPDRGFDAKAAAWRARLGGSTSKPAATP